MKLLLPLLVFLWGDCVEWKQLLRYAPAVIMLAGSASPAAPSSKAAAVSEEQSRLSLESS